MQVLLAALAVAILLLFSNLHCIRPANKCNIDVVSSNWRERLSRKPPTAADLVRRGYSAYCLEKGKSFRRGGKIVLTPDLFEEFRKLPDTILSADAAFQDTLHIEFTLGPESQTVPSFIQRHLNSSGSLEKHVPLIHEEIQDGLRRVIAEGSLGSPSRQDPNGWISIELLPSTQSVISQVICRLLVGKVLARDSGFTQKVADFSYSVILWSIIFGWCPPFIRPRISNILPIKKTKEGLSRALRRHILDCIDRLQNEQVDEKDRVGKEKSLLLQDLVAPSFDSINPSSAAKIIEDTTARVLSITFGAIDPTTVAFSQVVLDLLSQLPSLYLAVFREEAKTILAARGGIWTFEAVKDLKLMDSFIRESQRLHPIGISLAARKVICKGGWTFKNGDHAPEGSLVSVPTYAVHRDERWYSNPDTFDGFRFVQKEEGSSGRLPKSSGDAFLAFGYGRHACSGRAFGVAIMKLLLANLILNYDLEGLPERPVDTALGNYLVPDLKTIIRIRERGEIRLGATEIL